MDTNLETIEFINLLKNKTISEIIKLLKNHFVIKQTDKIKLKYIFSYLCINIDTMSGTSDYYFINEHNNKWISTNAPYKKRIINDTVMYDIIVNLLNIDQVQILEF